MREWIPVSTSPKGRLALTAVREFGRRPFAEVTVGELAMAAEVTTGALYHHFGSKLGLYAFVREDVERRLLDRMAGAAAAVGAADAGAREDRAAGVAAALLVGFDFAVQQGLLQLLGTPPAGAPADRLAEALERLIDPAPAPLGQVLAAGWRAALAAVARGGEPAEARAALAALTIRLS